MERQADRKRGLTSLCGRAALLATALAAAVAGSAVSSDSSGTDTGAGHGTHTASVAAGALSDGDYGESERCADSFAAPFAAGVAARFLQRHPSAGPATVRRTLIEYATRGVLSNVAPGTPNRLLYSGFLDGTPGNRRP